MWRQGFLLVQQGKDAIGAIVSGDAVDIDLAAAFAGMNNHHIATPWATIFVKAIMLEGQANGLHTPLTVRGPVARFGIDMQGPKTTWAMIAMDGADAIAWEDHLPTVRTAKGLVEHLPSFLSMLFAFVV